MIIMIFNILSRDFSFKFKSCSVCVRGWHVAFYFYFLGFIFYLVSVSCQRSSDTRMPDASDWWEGSIFFSCKMWVCHWWSHLQVRCSYLSQKSELLHLHIFQFVILRGKESNLCRSHPNDTTFYSFLFLYYMNIIFIM